ncbi:MAG: winged helix-turn-helix transcriptional regulator [Xanthomonadales bacterium]|nr:winged helix-turn-helix transcriptional regulator [Xanthomonadales bacterium]
MKSSAPDGSFAWLCQDITQHLRKHFDRRATRFELTRAQWRALKMIRRREGLSQTELAEALELEPIPIGRVIDRLQKAGHVERRADPADRRRWCLYLTAKAQAIVEEMELVSAELRGEALQGVGEADLQTLLHVLARIKSNLVALDGAADDKAPA